MRADFNRDGLLDLAVLDPQSNSVCLFLGQIVPPVSHDLNQNGIPDECERKPFHRGDPNDDGKTNLSDAVFVLNFLFRGAGAATCVESSDANNDGRIDVTDPISLLDFLFKGGPPPASPGPAPLPCGPDPDQAGSAGDLGCGLYDHCVSPN